MAEEIISCTNPVSDAKAWVRYGAQNRGWTFERWITAIAYPDKKAGLSGRLDGNHTFTLRYDWDANHGFHVNAMIDRQRRLYKATQVMQFDTETAALQRYNTLTEKISSLGDERAARWFMDGDD